ncbi:MAG TPA: cyclic nucleotide-binding domain-containing protein [Terriglobia bacterium]|nr:cyclic nucleotide-binding domain-containing protein [Terriglobia bacterium]
METATLEGVLSEHPFAKGLKDEYLQLMTGCASNVRFEASQFIFHEGEDADQFYMIREGKVGLEIFAGQRGAVTILTLEAGDVLGWSWLFPPYRWKFDARALEPTRALALDGKCLRTKCEEDHDLGYELLKRFVLVVEQRLQATRFQLLNVYS